MMREGATLPPGAECSVITRVLLPAPARTKSGPRYARRRCAGRVELSHEAWCSASATRARGRYWASHDVMGQIAFIWPARSPDSAPRVWAPFVDRARRNLESGDVPTRYDFIIIGSGGSASASPVEKGYRVLVLEKGLRFEREDFRGTRATFKKW